MVQLCRIRDLLAAPSIGPKRNNPAKQTLGGVEVTLEHETGLEPATPTLAKDDEAEEPPSLTLS